MINVKVSVKTQWNIEYVKKMILETLVHVLVGLISIFKNYYWRFSNYLWWSYGYVKDCINKFKR